MTLHAAFRRELAEHRLNRFLHVHLALCACVGSLPLFTPDAAQRSAAAWVLQAVLYCLSLSSLLLGLSAAHGDADEFPVLFTQPVSRAMWVAGKALALIAILAPASALLVLPTVLTTALTASLAFVACAAAAVCAVFALLGLAVGFWVRDEVRGLLLAVAFWFGLLFGMDLLLLALSGSPWVQGHVTAWMLPIMLNPLSALRVTMIFSLEQTAPASVGGGALAKWWLGHGGLWLVLMLSVWAVVTFVAGVAGAKRRLDL